MYGKTLLPLLFLVPPAEAHEAAMEALGPFEHVGPLRAALAGWARPKDPRLVVHKLGLTFPSPVGLAAGFDKNALRPLALAALGFGHLELGTVTARAQEANPEPNLFRLPADRALINRLGFPNQGAAKVVDRFVEKGGSKATAVPVGISIGKSRAVALEPTLGVIEDYLVSFAAARRAADFVVINVSSPNTPSLRAMQGPQLARALLSAIRRENETAGSRRVPLLLKIAPDLTDGELDALLAVVKETALDGVVATNTTVARDGLVTASREVQALGAGGLSGPPLRLRARQMVRRVRAALGPDATVIGVGGVETADDAMALIRAGADLVQIYTAFIYGGPLAARDLALGIAREMSSAGVASIADLVGADA